ncbi:MAG: 30S ribosomal protein S3 [Candidatus Omnitrophica bacterium]|nr:30S ribosomal protein S3 [Candidatus Omnitrophota bacterium]
MGHKVSPTLLRLGTHQTWTSRWFAGSKALFAKYLQEDIRLRDFLKKELASAAVARIDVERSPERIRILIHTARPGVLIGRRGENIQRLQEAIQKIVGTQHQLKMEYLEITNPYVEPQLISQSIAFQLEKRIAYRRAMKRAIQQAMEAGAKGIKIICGGRLAGSEMKRRETYREGKIPLSTLRSNIGFGHTTAHTTAGCIGIKVWVYQGDVVQLRPDREGSRSRRSLEPNTPRPAAEAAPAPIGTPLN